MSAVNKTKEKQFFTFCNSLYGNAECFCPILIHEPDHLLASYAEVQRRKARKNIFNFKLAFTTLIILHLGT